MQWKSIKWNDCQEYAILPQFWSSRKTSWLIFDPTAVLSSIDVLEKKEFLFTLYSLCFCHWIPARVSSSSTDISWQFLVCNFIFCFLFTLVHFLIPFQLWLKKKKKSSLPVGRLQPHLQLCNPGEENFQIHSALSSSQSLTERIADLVAVSGIPNKSTAITRSSGAWICSRANRPLAKPSSN